MPCEVFYRIAPSVERTLLQAAQVQHGFAKRLAWDGAGIDAHSTDGAFALDHRHFLAHFGRANGGLLSGRTAADYDQVVRVVASDFHGYRSHTRQFHPCQLQWAFETNLESAT